MGYQHIHFRSMGRDPSRFTKVLLCAERTETGCKIKTDGTVWSEVHRDAWDYWVDGYPVVPELHRAVRELLKLSPRLKFVPFNSPVVEVGTLRDMYVFTKLLAYTESCDIALGFIGYGDFTHNSKNGNKFMVHARGIRNERVKNNRDQYFMAFTDDPKRCAVRAAKEFRPYGPTEYAALSVRDFVQSIANAKQEVTSAPYQLLMQCTRSTVVETELRNLIKLGVAFVTPEFKAAAEKFMELDAEAQAAKLQKHGSYFIRIFTDTASGRQRAEVLTYNRADMGTSQKELTPNETASMFVDDLPYDIQMSLATLSTMPDNTSVPGVGRRVKEYLYWLERQL